MNKKVAVGTMLVLCASPFFCAGLKKGKIESKKPDGAHGTVALIKASLQEWNPGPFKLADKEIDKLLELAESGDGSACWQLACYYYCNGNIEEYINYVRKGSDLLDPDCLYEIIDNRKNQIPCTEDEKSFFMEKLRGLGETGNEDALTYWKLLGAYEKYKSK